MKKLLVSFAAAISVAPLSWWLLGEGVVLYTMEKNGAVSRTELADDFGFGILLMVVVPAGTLLTMLLVAGLVWRLMSRKSRRAQ